MKLICISLFLIVNLANWVQAQHSNHDSKVDVKGSNNIVKVIQAGTLITYNLLDEKDRQKLLDYVLTIPTIAKQLTALRSDIKGQSNELKNLRSIVADIARNIAKEGFISVDIYNKSLESYILRNKQLEDDLAKLMAQYKNSEFSTVLTLAEEKLKQLDMDGYQLLLEDFKQKRKAKIQQETDEIAQVAFLQSQNNYNQFKYLDALRQIEEALSYHPKINYWLSRGSILRSLSRFTEAIENYKHIDTASIGSKLKSTLYNDLLLTYNLAGEYKKALHFGEAALAISIKEYGEKSYSVATLYNNLGALYGETGQYERSIFYQNKALKIDIPMLGPNHPEVALSYNNLGRDYLGREDYKQALIFFNKALDIYLAEFEPQHPELALLYNNIGSLKENTGDYKEAIDYHKKALIIRLKIFGEDHSSVATTYNNLGTVYNTIGQYDMAIGYFKKALKIQLKLLGNRHSNVATVYHNLGLAYANKKEFVQAICYYDTSLTISIPAFGVEHPNVAGTYFNLGVVYDKIDEYGKAIEYYNKAANIQIKVLGIDDPHAQSCLMNLGLVYVANQQNAEALNAFNQVTAYKAFSQRHKIEFFNSAGVRYFEKGKYTQALKFYDLAKKYLDQSRFPKTDAAWSILYQNIARSYCYTGRKVEAAKYFNQAISYSKTLVQPLLLKLIVQNYEDCKKR